MGLQSIKLYVARTRCTLSHALHIKIFLVLPLDKTKALYRFQNPLGLCLALVAWRKVQPVHVAYKMIDSRPIEFEISFSEVKRFRSIMDLVEISLYIEARRCLTA